MHFVAPVAARDPGGEAEQDAAQEQQGWIPGTFVIVDAEGACGQKRQTCSNAEDIVFHGTCLLSRFQILVVPVFIAFLVVLYQ
jgi:hypothetical protein